MTKHLNLLPGETLEIKGFDSLGEPTITREDDGSLALTFNFMPPDNGTYEENLDLEIFDNFDTELSKVLDVEVVWEDREFFNIPSPKKDTIDILKNYLENFWKNHSGKSENNIQKELTQQNNTEKSIKSTPARELSSIPSLINDTLKSLKKYLENFWYNRSEKKEIKTPNDLIQPMINKLPNQIITSKNIKKELEEFLFNYFKSYKYNYKKKENNILIEFNEVIIAISFSFIKIDNGIIKVQIGTGLGHNLVNKYLRNCKLYPIKYDNYPIIHNFSTFEESELLNVYINSSDRLNLYIKNLKNCLDNYIMPFYTKYSTISAIDFKYNSDKGLNPFSKQNSNEEIKAIIICCLANNPNRIEILKNRLSKISDNIDFYNVNYNILILLADLMRENLIPEEEFKYYTTTFNLQNHLEL